MCFHQTTQASIIELKKNSASIIELKKTQALDRYFLTWYHSLYDS
jgi:hypothetical protein